MKTQHELSEGLYSVFRARATYADWPMSADKMLGETCSSFARFILAIRRHKRKWDAREAA